jgi:hypothetical protein
MAEKTNQPLAPANRYPRSDEESDTLQSKELRRKKRVKLAVYIAAFAVFQTVVILVFALTVMRVRTPKVRLGTVTFKNMTTGNLTSPFFDISFTTQVRARAEPPLILVFQVTIKFKNTSSHVSVKCLIENI